MVTDNPDDWCDDMSVALPAGVTVAKIAELVVSSAAAGERHDVRLDTLRSWGLTDDDAVLACERSAAHSEPAPSAPRTNPPRTETRSPTPAITSVERTAR
jgi:hypothetical protein